MVFKPGAKVLQFFELRAVLREKICCYAKKQVTLTSSKVLSLEKAQKLLAFSSFIRTFASETNRNETNITIRIVSADIAVQSCATRYPGGKG
jgi:hypothetical protein